MFKKEACLLHILYIIYIFIPVIYAKTQWIDPHSLEDDPSIYELCPVSQETPQSIVTSHYKQTISMLLNSMQQDADKLYKGHYTMALLEDDYKFIRNFLMGDMQNGKDWDRIDKIMSRLFRNTEDTYIWQLLSWKDYLAMILTSTESMVAMGIVFIILLLYKMKNTKFTLRFWFAVLFCIDYVYTWIYMLKEKEIEQLLHVAYKVPPECDVKRMSWMQYIGYVGNTFAGKDVCKDYHKIKDIDIFWSVGPSQIIGSQFGNIVLAPAEKVGKAFAHLINSFVDNSSWYMMIPALLMIPVLLLVLMLGGCVFMSFVTGRTFSFNLFHFIQFSFGNGNTDSTPDRQQRDSVQSSTIKLILPSRKKKLRLKEQKKTPISDSSLSQPALLEHQEVKQDVEDVSDSSSTAEDSSSQQEKDLKKTEDEFEVIG